MSMKPPRVIELYRRTTAAPSASTDQHILAAARARRSSPMPARLALAAGVVLAAVLVTRWMLPGGTPAGSVTNFGIDEGQAHAWLTTFQPSTEGPGSQEGLP